MIYCSSILVAPYLLPAEVTFLFSYPPVSPFSSLPFVWFIVLSAILYACLQFLTVVLSPLVALLVAPHVPAVGSYVPFLIYAILTVFQSS
eukprot:5091890-Pleurochrysis_carterae.AAC.1